MNNYEIKRRKKLIEVAMPLDVINRESAVKKVSGMDIQVLFIYGGRVGHWQQQEQ